MKKIILLLQICLLAFVVNSNAQATQLKVINNTDCDVFYTLLGDKKGSCNPAYASAFLTLSPGGTALYDAGSIPPLSFGDWINAAYVYSSMDWCPYFAAYKIGEPCTGWPNNVSYFLYQATADCKLCKDVLRNAKWISGGTGGTATLIFN